MNLTEDAAPDPPPAESTEGWCADYDRGTVEREAREREYRREKFKWLHLARRTFPGNDKEKHVLRVLADHAWAGPDLDDLGRVDGECVLLTRTIQHETDGLSKRTVERAIAGLVSKGIIEREARGRARGGRGANRYRLLPSNPFEDRHQTRQGGAFGRQTRQGGAFKRVSVAGDRYTAVSRQ